jgi:hypothetical protein
MSFITYKEEGRMELRNDAFPDVEIQLKRTPDDPAERDPAIQSELRTFSGSLRLAGVRFSQRAMAFDSATVTGYPLAEFIIKELGPNLITALAAAAGVWISGRSGRKVRLKVGDIEVEARTIEEVEQLLKRAQAVQAKQASTKGPAGAESGTETEGG